MCCQLHTPTVNSASDSVHCTASTTVDCGFGPFGKDTISETATGCGELSFYRQSLSIMMTQGRTQDMHTHRDAVCTVSSLPPFGPFHAPTSLSVPAHPRVYSTANCSDVPMRAVCTQHQLSQLGRVTHMYWGEHGMERRRPRT